MVGSLRATGRESGGMATEAGQTNTSTATPEPPPEVSGLVISSLPVALILDAVIVLALVAIKIFLFDRVLRLITRNTAHRSWRRVTLLMLSIGALYAILNPSGQFLDALKAIAAVALICGLLTKKLCWIDLDKAMISSFVFCGLAVALDMGVAAGLDRLIHERQTINRTLAGLVDARARAVMHDETLPPSPTLTSALQRYSTLGGDEDSGVVGALLAPVRADAKAQAKIREVNAIATEQAKLVNMLSGAGTNLTSRKDELKALHDGLTQSPEAAATPPAPGSDLMSQTGLPAAADPVEPPPAPPEDAAPAPPPAAPAVTAAPPPAAASSSVTGLLAAVRMPSNLFFSAAPPRAPTARTAAPGTNRVAAKPASAGPEAWTHARLAIKVTGVGHSAGSSYALVGNSLVRIGGLHQVTFEGRTFTFRLAEIDWRDRCEWEPVTDQPATNNAAAKLTL